MKLNFQSFIRDETDPEVIATLVRKGWTAHDDPVYDTEIETAAFVDGAWVVAAKVPEKVLQVTPRQLRLWLLGQGLLEGVEAAITGIPGEDGQRARIDWQFSGYFLRTHPLVKEMATALKLTDIETDTAFLEASLL